jgi:hypothetical protein
MHRATGGSERHLDADMTIFIHIHVVDQAQVDDIYTEFRVIDLT